MLAAVGFGPLHESVWRIVPRHTPRVLRACSRCGGLRAFGSSDRFRINAQQRRVDVWLIYRCLECEATWNCTLFTRRLPQELGAELFERLQQNDLATAWGYAFDLERLKSLGVRVDPAVATRVERLDPVRPPGPAGPWRIRLAMDHPCQVRLDRLLSVELGVSRSALDRWLALGLLQIDPPEREALRRSARDGQRLLLQAEALRAAGGG